MTRSYMSFADSLLRFPHRIFTVKQFAAWTHVPIATSYRMISAAVDIGWIVQIGVRMCRQPRGRAERVYELRARIYPLVPVEEVLLEHHGIMRLQR